MRNHDNVAAVYEIVSDEIVEKDRGLQYPFVLHKDIISEVLHVQMIHVYQ